MKKAIVFICFWSLLLASQTVWGDDKKTKEEIIKKAKFEMLKNTLEFLAKDSLSRKKEKADSCVLCRDFAQNQNYARRNVIGGGEFVDNHNPENDSQDLAAYKGILERDLTTGPKKGARKSQPAYTQLQEKLTNTKSRTEAQLQELTKTTSSPLPPAKTTTPQKSTPLGTTQVNDIIQKAPQKEREGSALMGYLPLGLSLLGLLVSLFLLWRVGKLAKQLQTKEATIKDLQTRIDGAEQDNKKTEENIIKNVGALLSEAEKKIPKASLPPTEDLETPATNEPKPVVAPPLVSNNRDNFKYALYADTGDGFSVSQLSDFKENDSLFELKITSPNTAELSTTNNEMAFKTAIDDPRRYLSDTCEYVDKPSGKIRTNAPGQLKLIDNKWRIITKAKISFY